MPKERKRRGWVHAPPDLLAAARSFDSEWWTLNVNAPGPDHAKIINLIRMTASRKEPDLPFGLIAVSISENGDARQDHLHVITSSRAGQQAVRRQYAGIPRAVTGKRVYDLRGAIGYRARNLCDDRGKWIISRAISAARRDYLAGLELPSLERDPLFDGMMAADAHRKAVDALEASKAPDEPSKLTRPCGALIRA